MATFSVARGIFNHGKVEADCAWMAAGVACKAAWERSGSGDLPEPSIWSVTANETTRRFRVMAQWHTPQPNVREAQFLVAEVSWVVRCGDEQEGEQQRQLVASKQFQEVTAGLFSDGRIRISDSARAVHVELSAWALFEFLDSHVSDMMR